MLQVCWLCGCKSAPAGDDGFGTVTVSTPLFTPLTDAVGEGKRLAFGDLRDEQKLAEAIQTPGVGISNVEYEALKTAVAASIAGPQLSTSDTTTTKLDAQKITQERTKERKRTFDSPAVPTAPTPETTGDAKDKLLALLEKSATKYQLPPGDVAMLVAAYKTYMVNLEEYYNVEGYQDVFGGDNTQWLPYKVHFTVSAQPGWYTRDHDAVAEITFGDIDKYRVLTVIPPETSQTLEELGALLRSIATSAEVGGAFQAVALKAQVDHIKAVAQRLEGLKGNTTVIGGYPAANKASIRFRPAVTPSLKGTYDLQPTSHIITALVLVAADAADQTQASTATTLTAPAPSAGAKPKASLLIGRDSRVVTRVAPALPAGTEHREAASAGSKRAVFPGRGVPTGEMRDGRSVMTQQGSPIATLEVPPETVARPATCNVTVESRFTVSQKPKAEFILSTPTTLPAAKSSRVTVPVPMWPETGATPFGIGKAFGYFWPDNQPTGAARAAIGYQINNPTTQPVALWVSGTTDPTNETVPVIIGTGPQQGTLIVQVPLPTDPDARVRVFLHAALAEETADSYVFSKNKVLEVVLEPQTQRPARAAGSPALSINSGTVQLQPVPLSNLTPEAIKALVGQRKDVQVLIAAPPGGGNPNPTTRP
jgi:hypothetical protein